MDDLVANSGGDVQTPFPGQYVILNDLTITGGATPDTVYMRDNEVVYVVPGFRILVDGIFLSQAVAAGIAFISLSLTPQPGDWTGFVFSARSVGRFSGTYIAYASTAIEINDADVTIRGSFIEYSYPYGIFFNGGLLHINGTEVLGSSPPPAAVSDTGGTAIRATGVVGDTLWINQSTIVGGNGAPTGSGGQAIFTINLNGPIGLIGNDRIQGGSGGYDNVGVSGAGGGGIGFHAFPVWDMGGPMPGINISGNALVRGGNGGINNASFDGSSGQGGQGIIISDDDYTGTVVIANNDDISGGDGGDNFADHTVALTVGSGGPGINFDNVGGLPTRIVGNKMLSGGKGGNNSGASMMGGVTPGYGGSAINLNDNRNTLILGNTIVGGHGGNNTLTGLGVLAGNGGSGIFVTISQNLSVRTSRISGGDGGDDYAGMGPGIMSGPGTGGYAIRSMDSSGIVDSCNVQGGEGGDNFGQNGEGRPGGYAVYVGAGLAPTFEFGDFVGGKGGDNYHPMGSGAGQGVYAFYVDATTGTSIGSANIIGGGGGHVFDGANAIPGVGGGAIVIPTGATMVDIGQNPLITVGTGGTHFLLGTMASNGSYAVEVGSPATMVRVAGNYIWNADQGGVLCAAPGVRIDGNTILDNTMGIILDTSANWTNITNNPMIGRGSVGIVAFGGDNTLISNNYVDNTDIGIGFIDSTDNLVDRTSVNGSLGVAVYVDNFSDRILVENSTITNSALWDFQVTLDSNATTLNTTFDGAQVFAELGSNLTVKNYLHVKVLDLTLSPLPNSDVEILDNLAQVYATPGFGGVDATTDPSGEVNWVVVTDRMYIGSMTATENITIGEVAEGLRVFVNNPRFVDMSASHQEVFVEFGADGEPPEIYSVLLDGVKFRTVPAGTIVGLAALLNDTSTGNSNIDSANWTIGAANWPGSPMFPQAPPFDAPIEIVIDGIDTTLWTPGSYQIWIYGCDAMANCNVTGDFATLNITGVDVLPPEINNVLVSGLPSISVVAGTLVDITATIYDNMTGDSFILNANYTIGQDNWPGIPMNPTDGSFDSPDEDVNETIDTTGWAIGPYQVWVYGCDIIPNCNVTGDFAMINIVAESMPPEIHNVTVNGLALVSVAAGTIVTLNATVNDTLTGGSNIMFANYTMGFAAWPGIGMSAVDGSWGDDVSEDVTVPVDTTGWNCGFFDLYVYGEDSVPNYNTTSTAFATIDITVCDFEPPEIVNVFIDGAPTQSYSLSTLPATFTLTGDIDDEATGGTAIGGANYTRPAANWPGTLMNPADGSFDTRVETATITLPTPTTPGTYQYCVYGWDQVIPPNYNTTGDCATLDIIDDLMPNVWNVFLNGMATVSVTAGTSVDLDADVDESVTGGSNIWDAYWVELGGAWPGNPMNPSDGTFDSPTEGVNATVDTTGWTPGFHIICVNTRDVLDNRNETCQNFATLIITVVVDNMPPEISNLLVDGAVSTTVTAGATVVLLADIDDAATGGSNIGGANYTISPGAWPGMPMTALDGAYDSPFEVATADVDTTGWTPAVYDVCVYAWDVIPNNNTTSNACAQITIISDNIPPTASGLPTGTGISIATNITITFDEPIDTGSVESSFSYTDLVTTWTSADGAITWSNGDRVMEFNPTTDLAYTTTYVVTLDASIATDVIGNFLDGNSDGTGGDNYTFNFQTEDQPPVVDITPPSVIGTTPDDQDTDVAVDIPVIEIEFDEPMNEASVDVELDGISFSESWDANTLVITPLQDLAYDTDYTVTVNNAEDLAGNPLGTYTFTFTTETEPVTPPDDGPTADLTWLWLLLIILAVVIGLILFLLLKRKKPADEEMVDEEKPEEFYEEPVPAEEDEAPPPLDELEFEEEAPPEETEFLEDEY
jgi:parallel beta-helix repeat protein